MLNGEMILSEILNSISILRHIKHVVALLSKMQFWGFKLFDCVHEKLAAPLSFVCSFRFQFSIIAIGGGGAAASDSIGVAAVCIFN